jgi:hypothetical protein
MSLRAVKSWVIRCDHAGCTATVNGDHVQHLSARVITLGWLREGVITAKHWCPKHRVRRAS